MEPVLSGKCNSILFLFVFVVLNSPCLVSRSELFERLLVDPMEWYVFLLRRLGKEETKLTERERNC